jgi:hypothetical protein
MAIKMGFGVYQWFIFNFFNQNQRIVHSGYLKKNQKQRTTKGIRYLEKKKIRESKNQRVAVTSKPPKEPPGVMKEDVIFRAVI